MEAPLVTGADTFERDDVMACKLRGRLRNAPFFQIGRTGDDSAAYRPQFDRYQTAIGQFADADCDVDAFLHQTDIAV